MIWSAGTITGAQRFERGTGRMSGLRNPGAMLVGLALLILVGYGIVDRISAGPTLAYDSFRNDLAAGRVDQVIELGSRVEVVEGDARFVVAVPEGADVRADIAASAPSDPAFGGIAAGDDLAALVAATPVFPVMLLAVGLLIWARSLFRLRPTHRAA